MYLIFFFFPALLILPEAIIAGEITPTEYVGRAVCAECHEKQATQWVGSHHDKAMQVADRRAVLGDFDNASLTHFDVTSSFYQKDGKFMVRTEGADGRLHDYEIKYTLGVNPLQQYLIEFPGGRLQALGLAWDSRPKTQGGQRWFHLYPNEKIEYDDELHWTQPSQNWNTMCAECHSTRLRKNYDPVKKTFATTWSEINVSCEACHGPGAEHVAWAEHKPGWEELDANKGLVLLLDERKDVQWTINPQTGDAMRSEPRSSEKEIEMCARCHSRRSPISADYVHGDRLLDHYRLRLLDEDLYFADGQIEDEVYVYGSFIQSKMYDAGVTCSDCHEPHSLELRAPGNAVCLPCHQAQKYDRSSHHFHKPNSKGGRCAECHMPPRTYMVVDPRHDHSMRIPRPDLSTKLGTPNACNHCHKNKEPEWAVKQFRNWYPKQSKGHQGFATVLFAGRDASPDAEQKLVTLIRDTASPDIARATALSVLAPYLSRKSFDTLQLGLADDNPLLRVAAVDLLQQLSPTLRARLAFPLLEDPVRGVRIEAARALADIPPGALADKQRASLERAIAEYIEAQQANAERPEAQHNMGSLYAAQGRSKEPESAYKTAIELNPAFIPAYINLADLYRAREDEPAAERVLRQAIERVPESADAHHALGLLLVRQKHKDKAIEELRLATTLNPNNVRYSYVYAVALNSSGKPDQAVTVLQRAHDRDPNNIEILNALVAFHRDMGNDAAVRFYTEKLRARTP